MLPTLTYGVRNDAITRPSDLEAIFEAIGTDHKSMFWIDETTSRVTSGEESNQRNGLGGGDGSVI